MLGVCICLKGHIYVCVSVHQAAPTSSCTYIKLHSCQAAPTDAILGCTSVKLHLHVHQAALRQEQPVLDRLCVVDFVLNLPNLHSARCTVLQSNSFALEYIACASGRWTLRSTLYFTLRLRVQKQQLFPSCECTGRFNAHIQLLSYTNRIFRLASLPFIAKISCQR